MKKFVAALLSAMILTSYAAIPAGAETNTESAQTAVEAAAEDILSADTAEVEAANTENGDAEAAEAESADTEDAADVENVGAAEAKAADAEADEDTADNDGDLTVDLLDTAASGTVNDDISWSLEDGVLTLSGSGAIPDYARSTNTPPWSDYSSNITSVVIGSGITSVGAYSFYLYTSITSVTLPDTITTIGSNAFRGCTALTSVNFPDAITSIGSEAFYGCSALTKISILPEGLLTIGEEAFYNTALTEIVIPKTVTSISNYGIYSSSLKTIYYTGTQTQWGNITTYTYSYSSSASIYYEVTAINDLRCYFTDDAGTLQIAGSGSTIYADVLDSSVKTVIIPTGITTIEEDAFTDCTDLSRVFYTGTQTQWNAVSVGGGNENLTNASIYYSVLFSGNAAYTYTGSNSSALIVTGTGSMSNYTYSNSSKKSPWTSDTTIKSITVESGITSVGDDSFYGCSQVTSATLADTVTAIGTRAFYGCSSLKSITIPASVESINENAFYNCSSLADVYFTGTKAQWNTLVSNMGSGNTALTSATVHYNTKVEDGFIWWINDGNILELSGSGAIGSYTADSPSPWKDNTDIISVILPSGITGIGDNAFDGCTSLIRVYYTADEDSWDEVVVSATGNDAIVSAEKYYNVHREDNILWTYSDDRNAVLTIAGYGDLADYAGASDAPWADYASSVKSVVIEDTITLIGAYNFSGMTALTSVEIPESVEAVNKYAFYGCTKLTSVTIPDSVYEIYDYAFAGCSALKTVTLGEKVEYIAPYAFKSTAITSVEIPDAVTELEEGVFNGCTKLTSVTFGDSLETIGEYAFDGCTALLNAVLPESVAEIGAYAFADCSKLQTINLPNAVEIIGEYAFYNCAALKSISIPDGCDIGEYAFGECSALTSVTIPTDVYALSEGVFYCCEALKSVIIPTTLTEVGYCAFDGCYNLESVYYFGTANDWSGITISSDNEPLTSASLYTDCKQDGDVIYHLGESTGILEFLSADAIAEYSADSPAPWSSDKITSVIFSDGITSIGAYAFSGCANIQNVYYAGTSASWQNASIAENGNDVIVSASKYYEIKREGDIIWSLDASSGLLTIGGSGDIANYTADSIAPWCGTSIKSVDIKSGVTSIGNYAFYDCSALERVSIPSGIKAVGNYAFCGCALESVSLPSTVTSIGNGAFESCSDMTSVNIPDAVTSIGDRAFYGCSSLGEISIPAAVANIGALALDGCISLSALTVAEDNAYYTAESNVLFNKAKTVLIKYTSQKAVRVYEIPETVTVISAKAFSNAAKLAAVIMPASVTDIGDNAFYSCVSLRDIYYAGTYDEWDDIAISSTNSVIYSGDTEIHFGEEAPDANGEPTYTEDVEILDQYASKMTAYLEYDGTYVTYVIEPNSSLNTSEYVLYVADFDENGALIGVDMVKGVIDSDTNQVLFLGESSSESCKAMLWDDDMEPVTKASDL